MKQVKEEWKQIGEDVSRTVQDAIMSGDYRNLSSQISELTSRVFDNVGRTINASGIADGVNGRNIPGYRNSVTGAQNYQNTRTYQYIRNTNDVRRGYVPQGQMQMHRTNPLYDKPTATKVLAILGTIFGFSLMALFGLFSLIGLLIAFEEAEGIGMAIFFAVVALIHGSVGGVSVSKLSDTSMFEKIVRLLGDKTYGSISDIASMLNMKTDKLLKKIKKMITKGWFRQGHLDSEEQTLITSNVTYQQYLETKQASLEIQQQRAEEDARINAEYAQYTPAQREVIQQGEQFVEEIHRCNDEIPGEVISEKIARMENSISMIIGRAKEEPSLTADLRRLMNYYLPTTVKLLKAYADLDKQGKSSENIVQSKKEIEDTIDTMNAAFDKLFDSMFEVTSMDISTDASVMKTLLEQEGLTGHSFGSNTTLPS